MIFSAHLLSELKSKKSLVRDLLVLLLLTFITLVALKKDNLIPKVHGQIVCKNRSVDAMMVIDKSGSMINPTSPNDPTPRIQRAKEATNTFIDILKDQNPSPKHQIGLTSISSDGFEKLESPLTTSYASVKAAVNSMEVVGATCIECAAKIVNQEYATARNRKDIKNIAIMLTDGGATRFIGYDPDKSDLTPEERDAESEKRALAEIIKGYNKYGLVYYTIGFGTDVREQFLKDVAQATGGEYIFVPTASEIKDALKKIAEIIGKGTVRGFKFSDENNNAKYDLGEAKLSEWKITMTNESGASIDTTTDGLGEYNFTEICDGKYTITETPKSPDWKQTFPLSGSYSITIKNGSTFTNRNFGNTNTLAYIVSGNVFVDTNNNKIKDGPEKNYTDTSSTFQMAGQVETNPDGTYSFSAPAGDHTVFYTSTPPGYSVFPQGTPPGWKIKLGQGCNPGSGATGATCVNGNIINLNFALDSSFPWIQGRGWDIRFDDGVVNPIPQDSFCSTNMLLPSLNSKSGVIFTGDKSPDFGKGKPSIKNWVVGGVTYPEMFRIRGNSLIRTSYDYITDVVKRNGMEIHDITERPECSDLTDCSINTSFSDTVYVAKGDLTITSFNQLKNNKDYIILANGNLTIKDSILVDPGTFLLFSVKGNIFVDKNVGSLEIQCTAASKNDELQGIYSSDKNFVINSSYGCLNLLIPDKVLHMEGSVVVNAARKGGNFINNRSLCSEDNNYPSFTISARPDYILNAPSYILSKTLIFQEVSP